MGAFEFNGKTYDIPGAYGLVDVIQNAGAAIPDFQVGVIIGRSLKGCPYNLTGKKGSELFKAYSNSSDLLRDYGDDNIYRAYRYAARHGAETVFVVNASANTKWWGYLKDGSSVNSIKLTAKDHFAGITGNDISSAIVESASTEPATASGSMSGAVTAATGTTLTNSGAGWTSTALVGKWVKITGGTGVGQTRKISANTATQLTVSTWTTTPDVTSTYQIYEALFTLTLTPPKNVKRLVESSGTADYIYLNSFEGLRAEGDVYLMSNGYPLPVSKTIKTIDTVRNTTKGGYKVTFKTAVAASALLADYARIFEEDTNGKETITWLGTYTPSQVADEINAASKLVEAEIASGATTLPGTASKTYFQNLPAGDTGSMTGTATAGTGTTLSDAAAAWTANNLINKFVRITGGTGVGQIRKITANTATQLTVATWTVTVDATSTYIILDSPGTNPYDSSAARQEASTLADYTAIAAGVKEWMKDFEYQNKVKLRLYYFDSYDSNVHTVFRDLAIQRRTDGVPICVIGGTAWGDINTTGDVDTNPCYRAKNLNNDGFVLCGGGAEKYPASLSFTPAVFGDKMANGVAHNLTRDSLIFDSFEVEWSETELVKLTRSGVLTYNKRITGVKITRGINTYQYQDKIWNREDKMSYLQYPRDLVDKFFRTLIEGQDEDQIGLDKMTKEEVERYCMKTINNSKAAGELTEGSVLQVVRTKAGLLPDVQIEIPDPIDFIGTRVFVVDATA